MAETSQAPKRGAHVVNPRTGRQRIFGPDDSIGRCWQDAYFVSFRGNLTSTEFDRLWRKLARRHIWVPTSFTPSDPEIVSYFEKQSAYLAARGMDEFRLSMYEIVELAAP